MGDCELGFTAEAGGLPIFKSLGLVQSSRSDAVPDLKRDMVDFRIDRMPWIERRVSKVDRVCFAARCIDRDVDLATFGAIRDPGQADFAYRLRDFHLQILALRTV